MFSFESAQAELSRSSTPEKKRKLTPDRSFKEVSFEGDALSEDETINTQNCQSPATSEGSALLHSIHNNLYEEFFDVMPDSENTEDTVNTLSNKMQSTKISTKKGSTNSKYLPIHHPSILTTYQDANKRNKMVNLEVHLPSCSVQEDIDASLEIRGNDQFVVLKEKMSLDFLYPAFFENFLPDSMSDKDKASLTLGRQDQLTEMQAKYKGENIKNEGDTVEDVYMVSSYKLPFICDDVFSIPEHERYPGTMSDFYFWNVFDDLTEIVIDETVNLQLDQDLGIIDADTNEQQEIATSVDKMKVFIVRLVAEEKVKEKLNKPTPKKRTINQLVARRRRN